MTSLARQLQRLAVPHTQAVLAPDKRRASLLFDPKEAANLDREAVYAIGVSGLEELENLDSGFGEFMTTLFSSSSQGWERSLQSREINQQLDTTLRQFLIRLSPYFLLKSAHKALEWLIYRYHIHEFNIDEVLMCVLPYHETKLFVRVIQLLPIGDATHQWNWLQPAAKGGVPLSRTVVVNHCKKDPGFLGFLSDMVPQFIKVLGPENVKLRSVVALWTCILLGAIQQKSDISERVLGVLAPRLVTALKSRCMEHKAGAYMLLSQLVTNTQLKPDFLASLLPVLSKRLCAKLCPEALMCLALVFQTQQLAHLPKRSFKHLCRVPGLVSLLDSLSRKYDLQPFLEAFLEKLVPAAVKASADGASSSEASDDFLEGRPMYDRLLEAILQDVTVGPDLVKQTASNILRELLDLHASATGGAHVTATWQQSASVFISVLERRYPTCLDAALELVLSQLKSEGQRRCLRDILGVSSVCSKHQLVPGVATTLTLGLHHPSAATRMMAVQHLHFCLAQKQVFPEGFVANIAMARLKDDNPDVVLEVLGFKQHLIKAIEKEPLALALLDLLQSKHGRKKWSGVVQRCVNLLCRETFLGSLSSLFLEMLPYMFITQPRAALLDVALIIAKTPVMAENELLSGFLSDWLQQEKGLNKDNLQESDIMALNVMLIHGLAKAFAEMESIQRKTLLTSLVIKSRNSRQVSLLTICIATILSGNGQDEDIVVIACQSILHIIHRSSRNLKGEVIESTMTIEGAVQQGMVTLQKPKAQTESLHVAMWAMTQIMKNCGHITRNLEGQDWLSADNSLVQVQIGLLDLILMQACCHRKPKIGEAWQKLVKLFSNSIGGAHFARILAVMWTCDHQGVTVSTVSQVATLKLIASTWQRNGEADIIRDLDPTNMVLPCLLVALQNSSVVIREGAMQCIKVAWKQCGKRIGKMRLLLHKLFKREAEIVADCNQVGQAVSGVFSRLSHDQSSEPSQEQGEECLQAILDVVANQEVPPGVRERVLFSLQEIPHTLVLHRLVTIGNNILDKFSGENVTASEKHCDIVNLILQKYNSETGKMLKEKTAVLELFVRALHTPHGPGGKDSPQTLAVNQVSKALFRSLPSIVEQRVMMSAILDVAVTTKNPQLAAAAHKCLKQLKLEAEHVIFELGPGQDAEGNTVKQRRRRRRSQTVQPVTKVSLNWERVTILLEVLQGRTKVKDSENLVTILFSVLSRLLNQSDEDVEYRKRLALSSIHNLTSRWEEENFTPNQESINMEVLVQCVRDMASPQTQQQALLVMAAIAKFFPEYILDNVMSIFTFVGSGLMTQDDSHSFQVITRTIQTLVPALMEAHQKEQASEVCLQDLVGNILQVFVDVRFAVPRHRCLLVFHTLLEMLGSGSYLWLTLTLLIKTAVVQRGASGLKTSVEGEVPSAALSSEVEFAVNVSEHFSTVDQVKAASCVLRFLDRLVPLHSQAMKSSESGEQLEPVEGVTVQGLKPQELRLLQFHLTRLLPTLLSKGSFVTQVVEQLESPEHSDASHPKFDSLLKWALAYLSRVARCCGAAAQKSSAKFWNALLTKIYDILDKVTYLLPVSVLLNVVSSLLDHELSAVRQRALELLSTQLPSLQPSKLKRKDVSSLLSLLNVLVTQASHIGKTDERDSITCQQMALLNIKILCRLLGAEHPMPFKQVFPVVVSLLKSTEAPSALQSNALLCLAELVTGLKPHAIAHLSAIVPPLLSKINASGNITQSELLVTSSLTALHRLTQTLPHFLSPYLTNILTEVSLLSLALEKCDLFKVPHPISKLKAKIQQQISVVIPARVLIPALSDCFTVLVGKEQHALSALMVVAREHAEAINRDDLTHHQAALQNLFCQALDLRNTTDLKLSQGDLDKVEESVIAALLAMVVRLSETSFRPMFFKLNDWACREDTEQGRNRKLVFFKVCEHLAQRLRSLFTLFVGHMISAAVQLLEDNNTAKGDADYFGDDEHAQNKSCVLLRHILGCLLQCLVHDTGTLVTTNIFEMLMQPLVDQLENTLGGDEYDRRSVDLVIPCVSQLAVSCQTDSGAKTLNYQVLLKTRHADAKVRLSAVKTVEAIAQKMGEDYMVLLPETIPFLAELMEDESEDVERECQQVVSSMEGVLGESLQKYF